MFKFFERHFGLLSVLAAVIGLLFGQYFVGIPMEIYEKVLFSGLFLLMLVSFSKLDFKELSNCSKNIELVSLLTFGKLILLPILALPLSWFFPEEYRVGIILLAAAPAAVATPGLLVILKGNINLGLILAVSTSLLAPFTLPLIIKYSVGAEISLDMLAIFSVLAFLIFGPFLIAVLIKVFAGKLEKRIAQNAGGLTSLIVFVFLISVIAPYSPTILADWENTAETFFWVILLSIFFHIFGWFSVSKAKLPTKIMSIIVMAYSNVGLIILLAVKYFDSTTVLMTVIYEFIWVLGLGVMKMFFAKRRG